MEADLVRARGIAFRAVAAAPMVGVGRLRRLANIAQLLFGGLQAWWWLRTDRPDVVFVTGGYVSVPAALAARVRRIPLAVYLPDVRPGRAVALLARFADRMLVSHAASGAYLPSAPERVSVTGYPVRTELRATDREAARIRLGLPADARVVLVFGGSQGAKRLNDAVVGAVPRLTESVCFVHVTGARDETRILAERDRLGVAPEHWRVAGYLESDDMAAALHAADLAVCRAGASVLGELPAAALPSILVPLPISLGHQDANADRLADSGAAIIVRDADLDGARLAREVRRLFNEPGRLPAMRNAAREHDVRDAAERMADHLVTMAGAAA